MTFCLLLVNAHREFGFVNWMRNQKELFGHKWWTLSNKTNIYCGTGIPGSASWWRSSKVSEYLSCFFWLLLTAQYGGYLFGLILCIKMLFSSTFIMSISVNWCGSLQNHRMFLELLNITRQCILRFYYININFIEHNIHVLCNMKSYECHLMKIIKG